MRVTKVVLGDLQVLWLSSLPFLPLRHPSLFQSLTSCTVINGQGHSIWRDILEPSSKSLRHLHINFTIQGSFESTLLPAPLEFPLLEVLQITPRAGDAFPSWMVLPESLKLFLWFVIPRIPSVPSLWMNFLTGWHALTVTLPRSQTLRLDRVDRIDGTRLLDIL